MKVGIKTRAGTTGREIECPKCNGFVWVYHFSWYALKCTWCKSEVKKTNWNLVLTIKDIKNEQARNS